MLLGMDAIRRLGGVIIGPDGEHIAFGHERFSAARVGAAGGSHGMCMTAIGRAQPPGQPSEVTLEDDDYLVTFRHGIWTVKWRWRATETPCLYNNVASFEMTEEMRGDYEAEVDDWIRRGWLVPFDGETTGLIPLMAVMQHSEGKVRPVLDYRELNQYVSSHTASSDVCAAKLRTWRQLGENLSIINLRKAYLQLHIDRSLWKYQVVE